MIEDVISIARKAGEIVREGFGKNFSIEYKTSEANLVTEIDKKSEAAIINFIRTKYPDHGILAEESGAENSSAEYIWVIDPLDGTTNFAHGLPIFSVSIGIQKNGRTICGAVYDVTRDEMFSAESGSGAFRNSSRLHVTERDNISHSLLVTGFPYDIKNNPDFAIERFISFIRQARAVRRLGSAALDLSYVAAGIFDGFWEVSLSPWDLCAGQLLVSEAGGLVTDFNGRPMDIFSKRILASNGKIHTKMMDILNNSEK
jgi:myo-inositol-1(or 4)-monophosphatase